MIKVSVPSKKFLKSKIMQKYGLSGMLTDEAISDYYGSTTNNELRNCPINQDKDKYGTYFISDFSGIFNKKAMIVNPEGNVVCMNHAVEKEGVRPIITGDDVVDIVEKYGVNDGIVMFGEYPMFAPGQDIQDKLNELEQQNKLQKSGKEYKSLYCVDNPREEYVLEGRKYTKKMVPAGCWMWPNVELSNGQAYDQSVWLEVSPIPWIYDEVNKCLISKYVLLGKRVNDNTWLRQQRNESDFNGPFEDSSLYKTLNSDFLLDIKSSDISLIDSFNDNTKEETNSSTSNINSSIEELKQMKQMIECDVSLDKEKENKTR